MSGVPNEKPGDAGPCRVREVVLARGVPAMVLENDAIAATVLPGKGADIYALTAKPEGIDVLWKSPWGLLPMDAGVPSAVDSQVAWLDAYAGGWQEIFPSGGGPCVYRGAELNFHGEASLAAWDVEIVEAGGAAAEIRCALRLRRSPFRLERTMRLEGDSPVLRLRERVTNEGGEPIEFMWGHHPAYGAPFLSGACRIDTNARTVQADDAFDGAANPLAPDGRWPWPRGERDGRAVDLSVVPGADDPPRHTLAYLGDFQGAHGWYGITNTDLGLGAGLVWPTAVFPYAWFWQEMHASPGYPWHKSVYVMAIEPFTTSPGQGLAAAIDKSGTQRSLEPGEALETELAAVLYRTRQRISDIAPDGTVTAQPAEEGQA
ncbi:MAG: aldose 1-epimerase [Thermomicrobiales bacterium]|nr:aldose 1-epimerase [Thermomicrobiales bacterium]